MTEKLFWRAPYQASLDTTLHAREGNEVELAATIFYAESGGQERDHGSIAGRQVTAARKVGHRIVYTLDDADGLVVGQRVRVEIDAVRRRALTRLHFAAELVLVLVTRALPAAEKIGAHIGADKARVDFRLAHSIAPWLPSLQQQLAALVAADLPIVSAFRDVEQERRFWRIADFAQVDCGGTHPASTAEVGPLRLKRHNLGQGKERIEIYPLTPSGAMPDGR